MKRTVYVLAAIVGISCLDSAAFAQQTRIDTYSEASDTFWDEVYPGGFEEL
jgi:hypothetical protein